MKFISKNLGLILVAYSPLWVSALSGNDQRPRLGLIPHLNLFVSETLPNFAAKSKASTDPVAIVQEFTSSYFGLAPEDYRVLSSYKTDRPELYHVHLRQRIDGLDVANGDMNININATGDIVSYGSSFLLTPKKGGDVLCPGGGNKTGGDCALPVHRRQDIIISPKQALVKLAEYMKTPLKNPENIVEMAQRSLQGNSSQTLLKDVDISIDGDVSVQPTLVITENNKVVHAHEMEIRTTSDWAQGYVDSQTGNVVMYSSYAKDAYYRVQPLGTNDPQSDSRRIVKDTELKPEDAKNWHYSKNGTMYRETRGNNVHAQADPE
ncbi:hypothetical protein IWQ62_005619, partial [Dispira parvispora]